MHMNTKRNNGQDERKEEGAALVRQLRPIRTREETAKHLGCSQQYVRVLECRALSKLARLMREAVKFET